MANNVRLPVCFFLRHPLMCPRSFTGVITVFSSALLLFSLSILVHQIHLVGWSTTWQDITHMSPSSFIYAVPLLRFTKHITTVPTEFHLISLKSTTYTLPTMCYIAHIIPHSRCQSSSSLPISWICTLPSLLNAAKAHSLLTTFVYSCLYTVYVTPSLAT